MSRCDRILAAAGLILFLVAASSDARAGLRARAFFPTSDLLQIRISPNGEWVVATAMHGRTFGIFVQRFGTGRIELVTRLAGRPLEIGWVGGDTLIARIEDAHDNRFLRLDLSRTEEGFEFERRWFFPGGRLVAPLPLVENVVLWAIERPGRSLVRRLSIDELVDAGRPKRGKRRLTGLGRVVASIEGTVWRWIVDRNGTPIAALRRDETGYTILYRPDATKPFEAISSYEDDDPDFIQPFGLTVDDRNLVVSAYDDRDTIGLFVYDPRTRRIVDEIYQRPDADVREVFFDPITGDVLGVSYDVAGEKRVHYLESSRSRYARSIGPKDPPLDTLQIISSTANRRRFIYWISNATEPGAYYLRDAPTNKTILLGQRGMEIDRESLSDTETLEVRSKDGTLIEAFLTRPASPSIRPFPLLVMPHGGPIGVRDDRGFDPLVQYFASWGFAVLQPNYRGSSGYGRHFENAGKRQWARGIEDDIDAAVEYAIALPEIDGDRMCILGGSYGGFSALASVIRHENRYRCAATINGVSDIPLIGESSDMADSARALAAFEEVAGDLETEREKLLAISPAYHLDEVETPVLIVYGDADRRVDPDHAFRVAMMLRLYGKEYEEIRVKAGAHSFTRDQWVGVLPRIRRFLTKHLMHQPDFGKDPR